MHRYTQSADIWAFGIIMLELATGQVPRKGMGFVSLVMQTVHGDVPSLADAATKRTYSKVRIPCLSGSQLQHAESQEARIWKGYNILMPLRARDLAAGIH